MSYITELICSKCGKVFGHTQLQTYCLECQAPLVAKYDLETARRKLDRDIFAHRLSGMWRWNEILPVLQLENHISLGEGDVPLLNLSRIGHKIGLSQLYVKDESLNPTGSFKARGLAAAISKAKELGQNKVIIPTAGNAGGAMAAYAARAGLQACIYMPNDTPLANKEECRITGAEVILVDGLISDAASMAAERATKEGWLDLSTFKEPYRLEGKKIMGYELAEDFYWELPDVIVYPTGGGTGLVGMWKAFDEIDKLGWLEKAKKPRMVSVQAAGCAPIIDAFHNGALYSDFWEDAHTIASGLRVPKSFADFLILKSLRDSCGTAVSVSDEEIVSAQRVLAGLEGIFACPEGAAALAGLFKLVKSNWVDPAERIVLFNTGTGLKYLNLA